MESATCVICRKTTESATADNWQYIWAYANRKGGEVAYDVCPKCGKNFKHAATIVDGINARLDREARR